MVKEIGEKREGRTCSIFVKSRWTTKIMCLWLFVVTKRGRRRKEKMEEERIKKV